MKNITFPHDYTQFYEQSIQKMFRYYKPQLTLPKLILYGILYEIIFLFIIIN